MIASGRVQDALGLASIYKFGLAKPFDQVSDTAQTIDAVSVNSCELRINEIEAAIVTYKLEFLPVYHFARSIRLVDSPSNISESC
jgi:hypothetical protein